MLNSTITPRNDLAAFATTILKLQSDGILESTFQPIIDARMREAVTVTATPIQRTPRKPTVDKATARKVNRATRTLKSDHEYVRLVACEIAFMDAYIGDIEAIDDIVNGYSPVKQVPTIGDVRDRYSMLAHIAREIGGLEFGRKSSAYAEALTLLA
jgi:hypothetical protein